MTKISLVKFGNKLVKTGNDHDFVGKHLILFRSLRYLCDMFIQLHLQHSQSTE